MKQVGICLMALSAICLGWTAAEIEGERYRALRQAEKMLSLLSEEIRCSLSTFSQVFTRVAGRLEEPWNVFLSDMAAELNAYSGKPFRKIWEAGVDGLPGTIALAAEDRRELKQLGQDLGYLDTQVQIEAIRHFLNQWEQRMEEVRSSLADRQRMYRALGVSAGLLFLVVWL